MKEIKEIISNLFKKKENNQFSKISLHDVSVKIKKGKEKNLYIGKILSISANEGKSNECYTFMDYYDDVSNKISDSEISYCEKYRYGIVKSINSEDMIVSIICCDGYLQRLKTDLNVENGNSYIIDGNNLLDNGNIIGKIIDYKYDPSANIRFNTVEDNKLIVFIQK